MATVKQFLEETYQNLLELYGHQHWWPSDSAFETAVGAILTQNTNWLNVEKAIVNLKREDVLTPQRILEIDLEKLKELIRPSGFFNQKSERLKTLANWWIQNAESVSAENPQFWRNSLLSLKGVGEETADSILLYCFDIPTFVIDTYTKRLFKSYDFMKNEFGAETLKKWKYQDWQKLFMANLRNEADLFNEYHALIVIHNKHTKVGTSKENL